MQTCTRTLLIHTKSGIKKTTQKTRTIIFKNYRTTFKFIWNNAVNWNCLTFIKYSINESSIWKIWLNELIFFEMFCGRLLVELYRAFETQREPRGMKGKRRWTTIVRGLREGGGCSREVARVCWLYIIATSCAFIAARYWAYKKRVYAPERVNAMYTTIGQWPLQLGHTTKPNLPPRDHPFISKIFS